MIYEDFYVSLKVSGTAGSPFLSNIEKYPYFVRSINSYLITNLALVTILEYFGWQKVAILYVDNILIKTVISICYLEQFELILVL